MIAHSASAVRARVRGFPLRHAAVLCLILPALALPAGSRAQNQTKILPAGVSKAAAASCDAKVKRMEDYTPARGRGGKFETRLTESEMNSYLAVDLSPSYHPCLKSIVLKFQEARLQAVASIDFDRLQLNSTQLISGLIKSMLTGVHTLTVVGGLIADGGKANFRLDQAQFDSISFPNLLVTEIISMVGRKQNPPFDPMQPTELPYHIQRVEVHAGYLLIVQ